jgi:hypothetical protein
MNNLKGKQIVTLEDIENGEKIIVSKMDNKIIDIVLKDGEETGGIVQSYSDDLTSIEIADGEGFFSTISFEDIESVHYL